MVLIRWQTLWDLPDLRTLGMDLYPMLRLYLLIILLLCSPGGDSKTLPNIYWNSTNPIFRIDNTDHVITGVRIKDRVNFICPFYDHNFAHTTSNLEYSEIYRVSRWGYDNCKITENAKLVGVCITPNINSRISLVFRQFTPLPQGLEFKPGKDYYFISTSNGSLSGISNTEAGLCATRNMKLRVQVVPNNYNSQEGSKWLETNEDSYPSGGSWSSSQPENWQVVDRPTDGKASTSTTTDETVYYVVHTDPPPAKLPSGGRDSDRNSAYRRDGYKVKDGKDHDTSDNEEEDDDDGSANQHSASILIICLLISILLFASHCIQ